MKKLLLLLWLLSLPGLTQEMLVLPDQSPLVSIRLMFKVGSADDPKGQEGVAALTAAMLSQGGSRELTYPQILDRLYPWAAEVDAQIGKEVTVFSGVTHGDNLDGYSELMTSMICDPGFRPDDFERVKAQLINFLKEDLRASNDEELGKEVLYNQIYAGHPYGHHNAGALDSLEKITLDQVRQFYRTHYTRGALTIGLAGGYRPGFSKEFYLGFSKLPDGPVPSRQLPQPKPLSGRDLTIVKKSTRSTAFSLGFPIQVNRSHKDWTALWLVRSYFGEHRSSNSYLYQRLREIRGLNYGDYAYIEYFPRGMFLSQPDPNYPRQQQIFQIWIRPVEPQNGLFTLRATLYELEKLVNEGLTKPEFEATREFLSKNVALLVQTDDRRLGYALDDKYYGTAPFVDRVKSDLEKLTVEDVNRVIRENLQAKDLEIVVITDKAEEFAQAVRQETPSPITYNSPKLDDIMQEDKVIATFPIKADEIDILPLDKVFR
ncbi:MAG: M16 family metallopeptidase [Vulcanimicrobiota bacterium]